MSRRQLTPEQAARRCERKAKLAEIIQRIADMSPEDKARIAGKMEVCNCDGHTLSVRNQLLIALQLGSDCTIVGGFRQWLKQGRCVKKGEHGASILFPRTFGGTRSTPSDVDEASETASRANGNGRDICFYSGTVFDISQTAPITDQEGNDIENSLPNGKLFVPPAPLANGSYEITDQTDREDRAGTDPNLADTQTERDALTIWNSNGVDAPALICAPPASMMNKLPPGGWTEADKVPEKYRKPVTPQVAPLDGVTPLGANPEQKPAIDAQWELL